jgi:hypothetical protein
MSSLRLLETSLLSYLCPKGPARADNNEVEFSFIDGLLYPILELNKYSCSVAHPDPNLFVQIRILGCKISM